MMVSAQRFKVTKQKRTSSFKNAVALSLYDKARVFPKLKQSWPAPSTDIKSVFEKGANLSLEDYFASSHFKFREGSEKSSMSTLKNAISLIHPRNRPVVAVDCEAYEHGHHNITEIGIAVLKPSPALLPQIEATHIIIDEHLHKRNSKYVPDNKDKFLHGKSYIMKEKDAIAVLKKVLMKYLAPDGILVGHSISSEIKYFKSLGIELPSVVKKLDTLKLHQVGRSNGGSLGGCLKLLGLPCRYLHNAGNDAYYTLLVALSYCDPIVRIEKNLDVYQSSEFTGKYPNEGPDVVEVDDISLLDL
ncbi:hypothetical protein KGF57_003493 [Candida theae]|uniref:Gfd2/YDR514C-like C-terminal domain-containing protein n=1 Tax=Candida theae TaxID=1198502 RepID=A0AAD5BCW5_9ASCO|nr:uncharacterized protein KGF57_003493 [Candida theae]KAI5956007.1 hypothetical protein KGF57_003493 [Candida theae]